MAIIKGTFSTNLKGRIGSVVYRNRAGMNIASQRPASVKNPQSILQQQQRMKFNSVAQAYRCLKTIADHSFEGTTYGAPSQAKFMSLNTKLYTLSGSDHGFVAKGNSAIPQGNFKISEGTIPSLNYESVVVSPNAQNVLEAQNTMLKFKNVSSIADVDPTTVSVKMFLQALGIQRGQQVSILVVRTKEIQYFGANGTIPQCTNTELVKCSFTIALDAADDDVVFTEDAAAENYFLDPAVLIESDNTEYFQWKVTDDFKLQVSTRFESWNDYANIAYGAIVSEKVGNTWLRSTQYLSASPRTMWAEKEPDSIPVYTPNIVVLTYDPKSEYYLNGEDSIL
jgi:hypothetical protein